MPCSSSAHGLQSWGKEMVVTEPVTFEEVAVYFSEEEWALLDPGERVLYWDVMQDNYEAVSWLGFPVSKAHVISWVEREKELWIPDIKRSEREESINNTHTEFSFQLSAENDSCRDSLSSPAGDVTLSEINEESHHKGPEQVTQHGMLLASSKGHGPQRSEQRETGEGQYSPERQQGNHPGKGQGKSSHRSKRLKRNTEAMQQKIPHQQAPYTYSDTATPIEHRRTHASENPFTGFDFGKSFSASSLLAGHRKIHAEKPFFCCYCGKSFRRSSHLISHERIHTGEKPFNCSDCGKNFRETSALVKHSRIHTGEKPFNCSDCGKNFRHRSDLVKHSRIHTGEKPFYCSDCGKSFHRRSHLTSHERIHTGEKPFNCSACGKSFRETSALVKHSRIHTGEKPFNCSACGKSFRERSTLDKHSRIHTGEKPFYCSACEKSFREKSTLVRHRRIHTGEKPFNCSD